jgi:amino acid adenylation domain-containing protein
MERLDDLYGLTPLQQGILFHSIYGADARLYVFNYNLRLKGRLDVAAFERAWQSVVDLHPILRSSFHWEQLERQVQAVHASVKVTINHIDWADLPESEKQEQMASFIRGENGTGFDLTIAPLMRLTLIKIAEDEYTLIWVVHHLLMDGWSTAIIFKQVGLFYEAYVSGQEVSIRPPRPFRDHVKWLQQQCLADAKNFWRKRLSGVRSTTSIMFAKSQKRGSTSSNKEESIRLTRGETEALKFLASKYRLTLNTVIQGAWALLLSRYSGEKDVVFGVTVSGRSPGLQGVEEMIGLFINTIPSRVRLHQSVDLITWLTKIQVDQVEAHAYDYCPLVEIHECSDLPRGAALFNYIFVFENYPVGALAATYSGPLIVDHSSLSLSTNYQIAIFVEPGEEINIRFLYDQGWFEGHSIRRMLAHFGSALTAFARTPHTNLADIDILTDVERQEIASAMCGPYYDDSSDQWVHNLIQRQSERTPDAVAVVYREEHLSYRELNRHSNQLANYLRRLGVGPEVKVGLRIERSVGMVISMLGILKAGGAYVPLDPSYPQERISFMVSDSGMRVLLSESHLQEASPIEGLTTVCIDSHWEKIEAEDDGDFSIEIAGWNLAYLIYTSGSTGWPKGVQIPHKALINFLISMKDEPGLRREDSLLSVTTISFDISVLELFLPLMVGARLIVASREVASKGPLLLAELSRSQSTTLQATPSTWRLLLDAGWKGGPYLRMFSAGEALPFELSRDLLKWGDRLWNLYGPTETTVFSTLHNIQLSDDYVLIGHPIRNTHIHLLDTNLQPVPMGVSGELFIGGIGLARGYNNRPDLTAERFLPDPVGHESGARMYQVGDLTRCLPGGKVECLGRMDFQVKIRGHRIELGEIETILETHENVKQSAVIPKSDGHGGERLVAYVVPKGDAADLPAKLRSLLEQRVPSYMVPSRIVILESFPLTPNGKVDRKSLPEPGAASSVTRGGFVPPQTEAQNKIAQVLRDVLQLEKVGLDDNFFDLGGHSLLIIKVNNSLKEVLKLDLSGADLPIIDLFKYPTVRLLADHLANNELKSRASVEGPAAIVKPQPGWKVTRPSDIAIVGMALRFPGAKSCDQFWENLRNGVESISTASDQELLDAGVIPEFLSDPKFVRASGVLEGIDLFDADFFGISPREAELTDPQHRLFLECAWECLEHAGYDPKTYGGRIGVYGGMGLSIYLLNIYANPSLVSPEEGFLIPLVNDKDFLATHVSYKLDLKGPSVTVQTACSTSLVAVHIACDSLMKGLCEMALAGAVTINIAQEKGYLYQPGGILSPDGHCRAFDAKAKGTVSGSGVGVVLLKKLDNALRDGDFIHAIIKGSHINNDGSLKVGYTAPSVRGQSEVIKVSQEIAGISPDSIGYVEAHGTGTEIGDVIEVTALTEAFRCKTQRKGFCAIGSVKTNIGHLDTAAGMAGLIKAVLSIQNRMIPPSLHFETPNPNIDFSNSPFYVNSKLIPWESDGEPRRAGVSSFGIGGSNVHLILEEPSPLPEAGESRPWQLLLLSAKTQTALERATSNLAEHLSRNPQLDLADVAYTLQVGRAAFDFRKALVCQTIEEATMLLGAEDSSRIYSSSSKGVDRALVFLFPGQGAQHVRMGRGLYQMESCFRDTVDYCCEFLRDHLRFDLRGLLLYEGSDEGVAEKKLAQTQITQPALFVVEYALTQLLSNWGINPQAMIGHSIGEYVAACLAGVFSLEDALSLVAARGRLLQSAPTGSMLAVPLSEDELKPIMTDGLSIAAVNGPDSTVVSGDSQAISCLRHELLKRDVHSKVLNTSHAFHSEMMEPVWREFAAEVAKYTLRPPAVPFLSCLSGDWITADQATDPMYWAKQLRCTVRFADGISRLIGENSPVFLEVGPGRTLSSLVVKHHENGNPAVINSLPPPKAAIPDLATLMMAIGRLWCEGIGFAPATLYGGESRRRVPLPTYPFERRRFWLEKRAPHCEAALSVQEQQPLVRLRHEQSRNDNEAGGGKHADADLSASLEEVLLKQLQLINGQLKVLQAVGEND